MLLNHILQTFGMATSVQYECRNLGKYYTSTDSERRKCHFNGKWVSSDNVPGAGVHGPVAVNVVMALAIAMSGNQFAKVVKLFKFLNINMLSSTTYDKFSKDLLDTTSYAYHILQDILFQRLKGESITIAGDCQVNRLFTHISDCVIIICESTE